VILKRSVCTVVSVLCKLSIHKAVTTLRRGTEYRQLVNRSVFILNSVAMDTSVCAPVRTVHLNANPIEDKILSMLQSIFVEVFRTI
jgi:hypothetical protein